MQMHRFRFMVVYLLVLVGLAVFFTGCGLNGSSSGVGSSGTGADADPWPKKPATNNSQKKSDEAQKAPLLVQISAKSPAGKRLSLQVTKIDLLYNDEWITIADKSSIAKLQPKPLLFTDKVSLALLVNASIPAKKYTSIRLILADTMLMNADGDESTPVETGNVSQALGDISLSPSANTVITINFDGSKITATHNKLTAPVKAFAIQKGLAQGKISGVITPATLPDLKIQAFWENSDILFGSDIPKSDDGTFTINNLPSGHYTIKLDVKGYHLEEPIKDLITVDGKNTSLGTLKLVKDE